MVRFWNKEASGYDRKISQIEGRFMAASREWIGGQAKGEVLEVGIGTGASLRHYRSGINLTGVDFSPAMLAHAERRAADLGVVADLRVADAMALPFGDASFDTVVSEFALCSVPNLDATLKEMIRVLRPGGTLLLVDHIASNRWYIRVAQWVLNLGIPFTGDHWTRRPATRLPHLGMQVVDSARLHRGMVEHLAATRAG